MTKRRPKVARAAGAARHRPKKRFGQHFLAPAWASKVVGAINPEPGDVFLEIGPGTGALTLPLAATGAPILGVEIDRSLASDLAGRAPSNVTILSGDFLETDTLPLLSGLEPQRPLDHASAGARPRRFRVVGNLPYYMASPILFRLLEIHQRHGFFVDATVMLQREVADRLVARPRTKEYGVLTILMAVHARLTKLLDLPPGAFFPPPKVRSSVVRMTFGPPAVKLRDPDLFERVVKTMFSQRRKTLVNALKPLTPASGALLDQAGIARDRRPETLQVPDIARLTELLAAGKRGAVL